MREGQFFREFRRVVAGRGLGEILFLSWFLDVREIAAFGPIVRDGKKSLISQIVLRSGFTIEVSEGPEDIANMLQATYEAATPTQAAA